MSQRRARRNPEKAQQLVEDFMRRVAQARTSTDALTAIGGSKSAIDKMPHASDRRYAHIQLDAILRFYGILYTTDSAHSMNRRRIADSANSSETLRGKATVQRPIVIITVRQDESDAIVTRIPMSSELVYLKNIYSVSKLSTAQGETHVVVCHPVAQGSLPMQTVVRNVMDDFKPEPAWIVLVGIAGGFPDTDFTLGDVVVSNRVGDFSVSAAIEGQALQFDIRGGPLHADAARLVAHLMGTKVQEWSRGDAIRVSRPQEEVPRSISSPKLYGSTKWKKKVLNSLKRHFDDPDNSRSDPIYHVGATASGSMLLKDTVIASKIKEAARSVVNCEMELAGAYEGARGASGQARLLCIRGISDIIGYERDAKWTEYACHSAASFAVSLVKSGLLCVYSTETESVP